MKYLLFENPSGHLIPILFPERISHEEMRDQMPYATVVSGGFVHHDGEKFLCHGLAKDLEVHAREEDAAIVEQHFKNGGES